MISPNNVELPPHSKSLKLHCCLFNNDAVDVND